MATNKRKRKIPPKRITNYMRVRLIFVVGLVIVALCVLVGRLLYIQRTNGEAYTKKVLSLQSYESETIPFQRGDIVDTNGTVLATSVAVYNVILDCSIMTDKDEYVEPTINALLECFDDLDRETLEGYAKNNKDSKYIVLKKKLKYEEISKFIDLQEAVDEDGKLVNDKISGVWFEKEYQRVYPLGTLASSVVGFTSAGDVGTIGLENYYDSTLNGINGRKYGYLNSDADLEKTVIDAQNGCTLVTTIDANVQSIVEQKIKEFADRYTNNHTIGDGAQEIAVVIQNPNNGEIIAMANYPTFDLNDPRNLDAYYTESEQSAMSDEEKTNAYNRLWQNYCVTATYEPGSVQKPFTVATGIETGTVTENMTYLCDGSEVIGDQTVRCVNRSGHGIETVEGSLMDSCNDALMQMSYQIGAENFLDYQAAFGFGQKTGIDLPGEAYTASLLYTLDNIKKIDLATNSFGQNYNCTMVQMTSAFSSLINGGTYYQPYVVKKITDSDGNTVSSVTKTELKQTVSESTSALLKSYLRSVVSDGTGNSAKVDGYSMGGKTGTAQMYDTKTHKRKQGAYLVSFMGYVPYDNPQLVIYCIVDQPNVEDQAHSFYAQNIVREILEEILPYMNIFPDEEKTGVNEGLGVTGNNPPRAGAGREGDTNIPEDEEPDEEEPEAGGNVEDNEPGTGEAGETGEGEAGGGTGENTPEEGGDGGTTQ